MIKKIQLYSPYAWAGGVLDAGGRFYLIMGDKGWSTQVRVSAPTPTLEEFTRVMLLPTPQKEENFINIAAGEQERVLGLLLPYMVGQAEDASFMYRYRVTAPKRRVGWKLTTPIKEYRERLKARM
jgi:hypothetical protein